MYLGSSTLLAEAVAVAAAVDDEDEDDGCVGACFFAFGLILQCAQEEPFVPGF